MTTYGHVTSPAREVRSRLQRVLEARHRPLAVSRASCRGFVQRQVPDAAHETTRDRRLKVREHVKNSSGAAEELSNCA